MKVFILGLDGLEYDIIDKGKFPHLKQDEYGKTDLSDFESLSTPILWSSFITGSSPKEHGVPAELAPPFYARFVGWLNDLSRKLGLTGDWKWKIVEAIGLKEKIGHSKEDFGSKGAETIFDKIEKSIPLWIPAYNPFLKKTELSVPKVLEEPELRPEYENVVWKNFQRKRGKMFRAMKEDDWNLMMAYFDFTDRLGHVYGGNRFKMLETYAIADKLAEEVLKRLDSDEVFLLIVSDHGMKPAGRFGKHSNHGFWSSNRSLHVEDPTIMDFHDIILDKL